MNHDDEDQNRLKLSHRSDLAADIAGYLLGAAILVIMFGLSGSY
ncbi:hypothetical protein SAMN04488039_1125 [Sulfitobacter dubius]|nr:hypothetical protein SAMN04488039_1125 [Sulfitobacter dubius]